MLQQTLHRAEGEAGVHVPGPVGGAEQLVHQKAGREWQVLPAKRLRCRQPGPAPFGVAAKRLGKPLRRGHRAVGKVTALLIARVVERSQHLLGKAGRLGGNGRAQLAIKRRAPHQRGIVAVAREKFVENEADVAQRSLVLRHGKSPEGGGCDREYSRCCEPRPLSR
jgi:hypothetical protein